MAFTPEDIGFVDIYPPINVARVGDSDEWYLGPEIPGLDAVPQGGFKDDQQKIKKQAVRFRVYAFGKDGKVLGEIDDKEYNLDWTVHVANKKGAWISGYYGQYLSERGLRNESVHPVPISPEDAPGYLRTNERTELIIDSGDVGIHGASADPKALKGEFLGSNAIPTEVHLGSVLTDERGRLVFLPGTGEAFSVKGERHPPLQNGFDNNDWVDTMCDGLVQVEVTSKANSGLRIPVKGHANVICAPPKFAFGVRCFTSLYDLIEDVYEKKRRGPGYDVGEVDYHRHIEPVFRAVYGISWTNKTAKRGHGPASSHNMLFDETLADPSASNEGRAEVLEYLRLPVKKGDKDNEAARQKQAKLKFMPQLSGDGGDATSGDANTWVSLTELQYNRFQKWARGDFKRGEPTAKYEQFEDIPLDQQPDALTKSALEWSTGAALFPGIETFWMVQFEHMYDLDSKFRFSKVVLPGDLGKGLALPWQSDFYMCRKNWWPSARPDDVVTEAEFLKISNEFKDDPSKIPEKLSRLPWERGLTGQGSDDQDGGLSMVKRWAKLGFVSPQPYGTLRGELLPLYVEHQRDSSLPEV